MLPPRFVLAACEKADAGGAGRRPCRGRSAVALTRAALHCSQSKATKPSRRFVVSPRMAVMTRRSCGDSAS